MFHGDGHVGDGFVHCLVLSVVVVPCICPLARIADGVADVIWYVEGSGGAVDVVVVSA